MCSYFQHSILYIGHICLLLISFFTVLLLHPIPRPRQRIHCNTCRSRQQEPNSDAKLQTELKSIQVAGGSSAHTLASFGKRSSTYEALESDGWEAPAWFLMRQAPGSQQWHDGYSVTGDAIILLLLLLIPSRLSGSLPPDTISSFFTPQLPPKMCCETNWLRYLEQKANIGLVCLSVWACVGRTATEQHFRIHEHHDVAHGPTNLKHRTWLLLWKQIQLVWLTRDYPCPCFFFSSFENGFYLFQPWITLRGMKISYFFSSCLHFMLDALLPVNPCWILRHEPCSRVKIWMDFWALGLL